MTDEPEPRRRSTDREISQIDKRLGFIERDVERLAKDQLPAVVTELRVIRDAMAEPDKSPLGRQLVDRAVRNAENIKNLDQRMDAQEAWRNEMSGVAKFVRLAQVLLGIAVAILALAQVFGARA